MSLLWPACANVSYPNRDVCKQLEFGDGLLIVLLDLIWENVVGFGDVGVCQPAGELEEAIPADDSTRRTVSIRPQTFCVALSD